MFHDPITNNDRFDVNCCNVLEQNTKTPVGKVNNYTFRMHRFNVLGCLECEKSHQLNIESTWCITPCELNLSLLICRLVCFS